jgi:DNA polymerase-3 subunit gamma/tau
MILGEESIKFDQGSVELVARGADGSMRDALSLLDQAIAYGGGALEESQVRAMMGMIESADLHGLIQALIDADPEALLNTIETIALQSPDFDSLLSELLSLLQKIAIIQVLPENSNNLLMTMKELVNFANAMNKEDTQLYYQIGMMGRKDLYLAPDPKSGFEMVMIRMLAFKPATAGEITNKTQTLKPATNNTATSQTTSKPVTQAVVHTQVEPIAEVTANNTPAKKVDGNWQSMIEAMGLKGLTKELAGNCVIKSQTDIKLELALATSQEHLLNPSQKIRFEQAIKTYLGEEVKLSIVIENSDNETPAETNARVGRERQKVAENSMNSDSGVQSLLDTFNGAIDQDSIQPQ